MLRLIASYRISNIGEGLQGSIDVHLSPWHVQWRHWLKHAASPTHQIQAGLITQSLSDNPQCLIVRHPQFTLKAFLRTIKNALLYTAHIKKKKKKI